MEIRKKTRFFQMINNPIIYKFFKDLSRKKNLTERILLRWQFLAVDLFSMFLNRGTTDETFQQSGKEVTF